jgi:hypothetical protein
LAGDARPPGREVILKKAVAAIFLALGLSGIFAAFAPSASAETACLDLYVRIGETIILDNERICV